MRVRFVCPDSQSLERNHMKPFSVPFSFSFSTVFVFDRFLAFLGFTRWTLCEVWWVHAVCYTIQCNAVRSDALRNLSQLLWFSLFATYSHEHFCFTPAMQSVHSLAGVKTGLLTLRKLSNFLSGEQEKVLFLSQYTAWWRNTEGVGVRGARYNC